MQFKKDIPEPTGSKNYIKLKDKESIEGVFMGDLFEFHAIWDGQSTKIVPANTPKSKFKFRVNFLTKEGPVFVAKVFENGAILYRQLEELHAEYNLEETLVKLTRNGTGLDTTYSVLPLLKRIVTPETKKLLKTIKLHELNQSKGQSENGDPGFDSDEEIPF